MICSILRHVSYDYRVKGLRDFLVSAKRKSNYSEPKLGWDAANKRFETVKIRAQLNTLQDASAFVLDPTYLNKNLRSFRWDPKRYHYVVDEGYSTHSSVYSTALLIH